MGASRGAPCGGHEHSNRRSANAGLRRSSAHASSSPSRSASLIRSSLPAAFLGRPSEYTSVCGHYKTRSESRMDGWMDGSMHRKSGHKWSMQIDGRDRLALLRCSLFSRNLCSDGRSTLHMEESDS